MIRRILDQLEYPSSVDSIQSQLYGLDNVGLTE